MIFNSVTFLIFFILFFQFYWLINNKLPVTYRNLFTILSSYLFYGWWDWRFLGLIMISSSVDYLAGIGLMKTRSKSVKNILLIASIVVNLGILGFFKYFNFFIESLNEILKLFYISSGISTLRIILPVGISFYTFQTLSYTIDVYKQKIQPTKDILSFFAFVSFFPQLVAGPIERAGHLLSQFRVRKEFSYNMCTAGLRLILWGLFKKMVIADNFGILVDAIFKTGNPVSGLTTIAGSLFFAFQIYADFSGYSDMAIGLARVLGIELMKNFNTPYFSGSFGEFWHRWHISLSTWFRDYLYIPLGGNRGSRFRTDLNILVTFLLSGLWHGANITFLIWGTMHGFLLVAEKRLTNFRKILFAPVVFIVVTFLWIPFRAENFHHFISLSKSLFQVASYSFGSLYLIIQNFSAIRFMALILVLLCFLTVEHNFKSDDYNEWIIKKPKPSRFIVYYILILTILLLGNFSVKPYFIYFQF